MMKYIQLLVFLGVIAGGYFGFFRDRYISYPIDLSMANTEGQVLSVRLLGRTDQLVQFQKPGVDRVFNYSVSDLSAFSKVKLAFLPKVRHEGTLVERPNEGSRETSELHFKGMQKELAELSVQLELLDARLDSKTSKAEKDGVRHDIKLVKNKVEMLKYQMEVFEARSR